jgi:hypothetical protein
MRSEENVFEIHQQWQIKNNTGKDPHKMVRILSIFRKRAGQTPAKTGRQQQHGTTTTAGKPATVGTPARAGASATTAPVTEGSVVDPDPYLDPDWIRIQWGGVPEPGFQEGKNDAQKYKKI